MRPGIPVHPAKTLNDPIEDTTIYPIYQLQQFESGKRVRKHNAMAANNGHQSAPQCEDERMVGARSFEGQPLKDYGAMGYLTVKVEDYDNNIYQQPTESDGQDFFAWNTASGPPSPTCLTVPQRSSGRKRKKDSTTSSNNDESTDERSSLIRQEHRQSTISFRSDISDSISHASFDMDSVLHSVDRTGSIIRTLRISLITGILLCSLVIILLRQDDDRRFQQISVAAHNPYYFQLYQDDIEFPILVVLLRGGIVPENIAHPDMMLYNLMVTVQKENVPNTNVYANISKPHRHAIVPAGRLQEVKENEALNLFDMPGEDFDLYNYRLIIETDQTKPFPLMVNVSSGPTFLHHNVLLAIGILFLLYFLIIFDVIHRTLAAMVVAVLAVAVLALVNDKPDLMMVASWVDMETLSLLFGMMVLVAVLCETGLFDFVAVFAYKLAKGKVWSLISIVSLMTAFISAFLDNVTTIMLMTPITIRVCEVMNVDPTFVMIMNVLFSNIGGAATAVGDPPNVIIISNKDMAKNGVNFTSFTLNMSIGIVLVTFVVYVVLTCFAQGFVTYGDDHSADIFDLKQEIKAWKTTAGSMSLYSKNELQIRRLLTKKIHNLEKSLRKKQYEKSRANSDEYEASLIDLQSRFKIRDVGLLIKTGAVLSGVILLFFIHSAPFMNISLGWIAVIGAIVLLVLADVTELEQILNRVELGTLIFFAALFIIMEVVAKLGLLDSIGGATEDLIMKLDAEDRLPVAIVLLCWVSALASSFIDNIPFTTMMVQIVARLGANEKLGLPLAPLVYALAFGACLGGNGTLIGASANVVCAGVAEHHGYRFSFFQFFKLGFPVMLISTAVATGYLLLAYVAIGFHF